ncbi:MAG: transposase [bacterium]
MPNGFLGLLWPFAESIGFFQLFKDILHVDMKEVRYTNLDRVKTLIASIAIGCQYGKDINHKLMPYKGAARCCQLEQFPDQSQINRFLRRFDRTNISELDHIFEHLLSFSGLWRVQQKVDIDFDCTGLVVYGRTFQLACKGYFPKKRSSRGYQLSLATTANTLFKEILSLHLDPGNSYADRRLWDAIYQVAEILGDVDRIGVVRADSASGTGPNIEAFKDHNLSFLIKGKNPRTAEKFARKLSYENWIPIDFFIRIADMHDQKIHRCPYPIRVIVVETTSPKGRKKYSHLYTDIEQDPENIFHRYNKRQNIESIIKEDKYALYITHLRTRKFLGILSFLYFAMITYNLLSLFKYSVLRETGLENMAISELVNKLMDIPAKIQANNKQLSLAFPEKHSLCRKFFAGHS